MYADRNGASGFMRISCKRAFSMLSAMAMTVLIALRCKVLLISRGRASRLANILTDEFCISGSENIEIIGSSLPGTMMTSLTGASGSAAGMSDIRVLILASTASTSMSPMT